MTASPRLIALLLLLCAAAPASSAVSGGGVTLHSVDLTLPDRDELFPGAGADAINANCLACHSAAMVLAQPPLSRGAWQSEVDKMRNTFKAPVAAEDVPAIVDYLDTLSRARDRH
jgi:mono/diheme cytochrome c family protein